MEFLRHFRVRRRLGLLPPLSGCAESEGLNEEDREAREHEAMIIKAGVQGGHGNIMSPALSTFLLI